MDIALYFAQGQTVADIYIDAPGVLTGKDLESALVISIFTDRRANDDDNLELSSSRRGWWGDTYNPIRNDKIGSRLWLLRQSKMTQETLTRAREYVLEATRWLLDDNVASRIDVITEFYNSYTIAIQVTVQRPTGSQTFNFQYVWNNI